MTENTGEATGHTTRLSKSDSQVAGYENQDAEDLDALFDSIVAENRKAQAGGAQVTAPRADELLPAATGTDSNNPLLHGSLSTGSEQGMPSSQRAAHTDQSSEVIEQIGRMTRTLHDALRELGLSKKIEKAASSIPDARDRLNYVAILTQQAAERVLNATEAAQPLVEKIEVEAYRLSGQWQMLSEKQLDVEQFKDLAMQTRAFLYEVPKQTKATHAYLMEIMMAQDFQDLTGQVIKKIIDVTENLEQQLLALLLENATVKVKTELNPGLSGPVINPSGGKDEVSSQSRVDDLLEGLGF